MENKFSLQPIAGAQRSLRKRLSLREEFVLALLPTATVLTVMAIVEQLTEQRLLFASLASSAFLIYLDPQHGTNAMRTLISSQMMAATFGLITYLYLGNGYLSGGVAMVVTIILMIAMDVVHPPAVSTSLSFALRTGDVSNLWIFGMALGIIAILVILERAALWLLAYYSSNARSP